MKPVSLKLMTRTGDVLGVLPVPELMVLPPGQATQMPLRPRLHRQWDEIRGHVHTSLTSEGLRVAMDSVDLELVLSAALLDRGDSEEVVVPIVVEPIEPTTSHVAEIVGGAAVTSDFGAPQTGATAIAGATTTDALDELFELGDGGTHHE